MTNGASQKAITLAVLVAALGYFVDIYDLVLFSIVRVKSLEAIGVTGAEAQLSQGIFLINMQMTGMLLGGILWGVLGDKKGRLSVLFGSIVLYSLANIANAFVTTVPQYALARLIAGIGLAGELGAGITLVSEMMPKESRGIGTSLVASIGILGAVAAFLVGDQFQWSTAYLVGGFMGLGLLALRVGVIESGMFEGMLRKKDVSRGNFLSLFTEPKRALRYLSVIFIGVPLWFVVGILITFSPEIGKALGMPADQLPNAGKAIMYCYIGLAIGDLASGIISYLIKSRKKAVMGYMVANAAMMAVYFFAGPFSLAGFYLVCLALGLACGYWAMFVTIAAEQFGTNIRATAATSAPNFVRGAVVLLTLTFKALKPSLGVVGSAEVVGFGFVAVAFIALGFLEETYGKDLDYVEDPLL